MRAKPVALDLSGMQIRTPEASPQFRRRVRGVSKMHTGYVTEVELIVSPRKSFSILLALFDDQITSRISAFLTLSRPGILCLCYFRATDFMWLHIRRVAFCQFLQRSCVLLHICERLLVIRNTIATVVTAIF